MGTFKGLKSLDTCPENWLELYTKNCGECYRPMVPKRRTAANPTLLRWFASAGGHAPDGTALCSGCLSRARRLAADGPPAGHTAPPRRKPAAPLSPSKLRELRRLVGVCVECGWCREATESHVSRGCKLAPRASTTRKMVA